MKKLLSLFITLAIMLSLVGCGGEGGGTAPEPTLPEVTQTDYPTVYQIKQQGFMTVGITPDYVPYAGVNLNNLSSGDDKYYGYDLSLARYIAENLGVKLHIKTYDFEELFTALDTGECDMIMSGIARNGERELTYDFTDSYIDGIKQVILVSKDNEESLKTVSDFNGKTIGAVGIVAESIASENFGMSGATISQQEDTSSAVQNLTDGYLDGVMLPEPIAKAYALRLENGAVSSVEITTNMLGAASIATAKGKDDFVGYLNLIIQSAKDGDKFTLWSEEIAEILAGLIQ